MRTDTRSLTIGLVILGLAGGLVWAVLHGVASDNGREDRCQSIVSECQLVRGDVLASKLGLQEQSCFAEQVFAIG
ncbi:MAG: hypothetical protein WCK89_24915, partial [bacterium]